MCYHYFYLQIKRLNAEIETLGANLTEVMQKENDTANQVSLTMLDGQYSFCDSQTIPIMEKYVAFMKW